MPYANNKGAVRPAHLRSLMSTFVIRCLDNIISILAKSKISRLYLSSVAEQLGLGLTWSQTLKTGFLVKRLIYGTLDMNRLEEQEKARFKFYCLSQ